MAEKVLPFRSLLERFFTKGQVPTCKNCGCVIKPNVILTGEELPAKAVLAARRAQQMGHGGITHMAEISGLDRKTIRKGVKGLTER